MNKFHLRRAIPILALAGVLALLATSLASAGPSKAQASDLKIGVGMPLSGPDAGLAVPVIRAVKLVVKQANAGAFGKLPGKLSYSIQDDQDKPEIGATVARKFCGDKSIGAVIGHFASIVSLGTQAIYSRCGPMAEISPTSSNDTLTQLGYSNFFRLSATNSNQAVLSAGWVKKFRPNVKSIATIDGNDVTTTQLANAFSKAVKAKGISTTSQEHITSGATDFRGVLTKIIAEKPDLIYVVLFTNDGSLIIKQARELGYKGILFGIDAMSDPAVIKLAGPANAEGFLYTNLGLDPTKIAGGKAFTKVFRAEYKVDPSSYAANTWDAVRVLVKAWQKTGSNDRAALVKVIGGVKFRGVQGPVAFTKTGEQVSPAIGVYEIKGGKTVYVGAGIR